MEQHPVPQNILEVEFKLFGSFTLKQFSKILFGCLAALIMYFLPIPEILKFPGMGIAVILGIALAIIPNLGVWIAGYLKALFISPRYVWKKETVTPEILKTSTKRTVVNRQQVNSAQNQRKVNLSEISLNELFGTRGTSIKNVLEEPDPLANQNSAQETNLDRLYTQLYSRIEEKKVKQSQAQMPIVQESVQAVPVNVPQQRPVSQLETPEDYQNEINRLKKALQNLVKDQNYKENESDILEQINELYQHLKFTNEDSKNSESKILTNANGKRLDSGQHMFGIVVDKKDQPISDVQIKLKDISNDQILQVISMSDGKFTTPEALFDGDYEVSLNHPTLKFHTYKIKVGNQQLPAYKFREK